MVKKKRIGHNKTSEAHEGEPEGLAQQPRREVPHRHGPKDRRQQLSDEDLSSTSSIHHRPCGAMKLVEEHEDEDHLSLSLTLLYIKNGYAHLELAMKLALEAQHSVYTLIELMKEKRTYIIISSMKIGSTAWFFHDFPLFDVHFERRSASS